MEDGERIAAAADRLTPEAVQLAYQICVQGRADLALAPDEATGFSMTLLRLLAFEPAGRAEGRGAPGRSGAVASGSAPPRSDKVATAVVKPIRAGSTPEEGAPAEAGTRSSSPDHAAPAADGPAPAPRALPEDSAAWPAFVAELRLAPMAAQLAAQTELKSIAGNVVTLALPAAYKHLADRAYADKLKAALDQSTGRKWMLAFEVGSSADASLASQKQRELADAKAKTEAAFRSEPFVQDALARFDAKIRPDSIKPVS
jgi:DNA polymerase-3 subunit gamma/tau